MAFRWFLNEAYYGISMFVRRHGVLFYLSHLIVLDSFYDRFLAATEHTPTDGLRS